jgi:hypothetical protein
MEIKFSCQELETQIKRDMPDKDAKTRADKTEEISKQQNCKVSQAYSTKNKILWCQNACCVKRSSHCPRNIPIWRKSKSFLNDNDFTSLK